MMGRGGGSLLQYVAIGLANCRRRHVTQSVTKCLFEETSLQKTSKVVNDEERSLRVYLMEDVLYCRDGVTKKRGHYKLFSMF